MKPKLVVFSLGWGCDPRIAENQLRALRGADTLWLYDWRKALDDKAVERTREKVTGCAERYLIAWSFGVWAAERLFHGIDFTRAVALNGTPLPADEGLGIGLRRLSVTLRGLERFGIDAYTHKAYVEHYERLRRVIHPRGAGADEQELHTLIEESRKPYTPSLRWDAAIVGSGDEIFPPENMAAYWGRLAKTLPLPHFPFADPGLSAELLGFEK